LLGRPIKKTSAQADFIRCHPWRSPFGPAEAVQIYSRKICGKGDLNLKPAFTSRRDDAAVLSCMAYVDLNPISAKMAKTSETSQHISIQKRTEAIQQQNKRQPYKLLPFVGNPRQDMPQGMAFSLQDYCELVDTTGRIIRADKAGAISSAQSPILSRLGLSEEQWLTLTTEFEQHFCYAAGAEQMMQAFRTHTHRKRIGGMKQAKRLLS
jgi:hypothetical protein